MELGYCEMWMVSGYLVFGDDRTYEWQDAGDHDDMFIDRSNVTPLISNSIINDSEKNIAISYNFLHLTASR